MSVSGILGQAENSTATTTNKTGEDKDMFLKLLVAQLTHQDPLNPAEDTEFIAQLAQFTQVEELQKLNAGMTQMVDTFARDEFLNASMLIGQSVLAGGSTISKYKTKDKDDNDITAVTTVWFQSEQDMATCVVNVHGPGGYILYSEDMGSLQAGAYNFTWDGTGPASMTMPNGVYEFSVSATNMDGQKIMTSNQVFGMITQVERDEDGVITLHMLDGRSVALADVSVSGVIVNTGSDEEAPAE